MRYLSLLGRSSLVALATVVAMPALAQTPVATPPSDAGGQTDEGGTVSNADIIVTASKREQTLQDTPISVSVTPAETIERAQVRDILDLQTLVPSLKVGQLQSSANTNFIIRGFGNGANNAGIEPSVGVFIDGVYRSRSAAQIGDLPNVKRVEVLRGPQSTLFGKNASAGIISVVTQEPQFELGGNLEASYGNYNAVVLKGYVTGPLSDNIALSIAGNYNRRDGYARYINLGIDGNDRNRYGGRAQLLFKGAGSLRIRLIGDYDKIDEICCTVSNLFAGPTAAAIRAIGGNLLSNQPYAFDSYANFPSVNKIDNYGVSGQVDFDLTDAISFTSISAYRGVRSFTNQDSDFTSADSIGSNANHTAIDTYTQEVRLASDFAGPLNFLLGGFFFKEDITIDSSLTFGRDFRNYANALTGGAYGSASLEANLRAVNPGLPAGQFGAAGQGRSEHFDYNNQSYSIFGQVDFEIIDGLTLTAGLNYTHDRKRVASNNKTTDIFSTIDLQGSVARLTAGGIATTVGGALGLGRAATAAEVAGFAAAAPGTFAAIQAGVAAQVNPILGLAPLQFLPPFLNFPNAVENGRTKDSDLSYTARLSYKLNRNLSGYLTYATGFKASSFNLSTDSRPFPSDLAAIRAAGLAPNNLTTGTRFARPEDAEVYEAGLKGTFGGFNFNLAVFKQTLRDFQSNVFQGTGFVLGNAEKQSTFGVEVDSVVSPSRNFNVTFSYTFLDPKYDLFTGGSAFNPATNTVVATNLTGRRPSGISRNSISVGANHTAELTDSLKLISHVDYSFGSAFQIAQGLSYKASPESLNASIGLQLDNGLELTAFARNITQPKYNPVIFPGVAQAGTLSAYPSPPRFYGVTGRFKF